MASCFKRGTSRSVSISQVDLDYLVENTELKNREELQTQFDNFIAKNPKGYMKKDDFDSFVKQMYPSKNGKKIKQRLFNMIDEDRDGHITFKEFMMVMCIMANGTPEQNLRQIFKTFDDNGNGTIGLDELKKFAKDVSVLLNDDEKESIKQDEIQKAFKIWDKDQNGEITEDEFVTAVLNHDKIGTMLTMKVIDLLT